MGIKFNIRLPRLPSPIQRIADKAGASQALGSDWAWLADFRDAVKAGSVASIRECLVNSPLTYSQIESIQYAASAALLVRSVQTDGGPNGEPK